MGLCEIAQPDYVSEMKPRDDHTTDCRYESGDQKTKIQRAALETPELKGTLCIFLLVDSNSNGHKHEQSQEQTHGFMQDGLNEKKKRQSCTNVSGKWFRLTRKQFKQGPSPVTSSRAQIHFHSTCP